MRNNGDDVPSWVVAWRFPDPDQRVTGVWGATTTQDGATVEARSLAGKGQLAQGGTVSFGFDGLGVASRPSASSFTVNGQAVELTGTR